MLFSEQDKILLEQLLENNSYNVILELLIELLKRKPDYLSEEDNCYLVYYCLPTLQNCNNTLALDAYNTLKFEIKKHLKSTKVGTFFLSAKVTLILKLEGIEEAINWLIEGKKIAPDIEKSTYEKEIGKLYFAHQNYVKAKEHFLKAVHENLFGPIPHLDLADHLESLGSSLLYLGDIQYASEYMRITILQEYYSAKTDEKTAIKALLGTGNLFAQVDYLIQIRKNNIEQTRSPLLKGIEYEAISNLNFNIGDYENSIKALISAFECIHHSIYQEAKMHALACYNLSLVLYESKKVNFLLDAFILYKNESNFHRNKIIASKITDLINSNRVNYYNMKEFIHVFNDYNDLIPVEREDTLALLHLFYSTILYFNDKFSVNEIILLIKKIIAVEDASFLGQLLYRKYCEYLISCGEADLILDLYSENSIKKKLPIIDDFWDSSFLQEAYYAKGDIEKSFTYGIKAIHCWQIILYGLYDSDHKIKWMEYINKKIEFALKCIKDSCKWLDDTTRYNYIFWLSELQKSRLTNDMISKQIFHNGSYFYSSIATDPDLMFKLLDSEYSEYDNLLVPLVILNSWMEIDTIINHEWDREGNIKEITEIKPSILRKHYVIEFEDERNLLSTSDVIQFEKSIDIGKQMFEILKPHLVFKKF